ncbi:hypothetical protein EZV62_014727 [Acer yangbiense]|uniref:SAM-dependent MTase RsmB/NOP-type domain-containing protein n=1 Tax=Acer yangbiense TaxID=1000413 RepID=A0A5C7HTM7_9ROSI|nr:hypothetical protein EZV62_014727 [Acer yangbiense]
MGGGGGGGREGRSHRSRTQRKHFKQSRDNVWKRSKSDPSSTEHSPWQPFATQNPSFDEYYKEQGIVAAEEWDSFIEVLRRPLPAAFRINSRSKFSAFDCCSIDCLMKPAALGHHDKPMMIILCYQHLYYFVVLYAAQQLSARLEVEIRKLVMLDMTAGPSSGHEARDSDEVASSATRFQLVFNSQFCADIRSQLENDFMKSLQAEVIEGGEAEAIRPLPWYPDNLAWHSNFSRMQLRKNQMLERFHEFLKLENEIGNITRQEAVSMVPPLFLDVHPDHFVLDMCAAPGSKTFQLLEIIHRSLKPGALPNGMIIANDLDVQRCNLLIHQTKRMCTANLIVTNHEAQHFPGCRNKKVSDASVKEIELKSNISQLLFDRVLCDVPCSGDGTLRKAPDIWRKWNVGLGNGVHSLQVQIAMRVSKRTKNSQAAVYGHLPSSLKGKTSVELTPPCVKKTELVPTFCISLLKVGGRIVYSTCSMNPVENEAVVAEILRKCQGSVELLDVSSELPQLVRRPGLRKWKVRDKGVWLTSYKNVPKYRRTGIVPSMFPSGRTHTDPTDNDHKPEDVTASTEDGTEPMVDAFTSCDDSDVEVSDLPLERCMRLVPHDQNSGAFFVAVLKKVSSLPVFAAAVQEKCISQENLVTRNDEPNKELSNQVTEDTNGSEVNVVDDTNEKFAEEALEANLIDNEEDGAGLETDPCDTSEKNESEEAQVPVEKEADSKRTGGKRKLQIQGKWKGVDPVLFFRDETIINSIKAFYGIEESFPLNGHLVSRNSDTNHVKRVYYVSKSVKDALELNFQVGQQLKITSVGLKMFERQTSREGNTAPCSFRISSEGLPVILPYVTKQILHASPVDFKHLLQYKTIKFADFVDAEFGEKATKLMMGCCVIVLGKGSKASSDPIQIDASTIAIGCWKGRGSLSVMVSAIDCQELLERLLIRMEPEPENGDSLQENNGNTDEVKDMDDNGKNEESESIKMDSSS